jgi:hypothetical protein
MRVAAPVRGLVKTFTESVVMLMHDAQTVRLFRKEQSVQGRPLNNKDLIAMGILIAPQALKR